MNKETFLKLVPYVNEDAKPNNDDRIYQRRLPLDKYDYDYSHAIVTYLKKCGCKIHETNWNFFGGFYIYYSREQKYIDPVEFIEAYKGGIHFDSRTKLWLWIFFSLILILALIAAIKIIFG